MLHDLVASPTQSLPPLADAGLLQVFLWVPPPQTFEHTPKRDHPPSSVLYSVMPSATRHTRKHDHDRASRATRTSISRFYVEYEKRQHTTKPMHAYEPYFHTLAHCTLQSLRLHNVSRHSQEQGRCKFCCKSRRHKL